MLNLSSAAKLEKNSLESTGMLAVILDITLPDDTEIPGVCSGESDITYDGVTYTAFPFQIDDLAESRPGEQPRVSIMVGNVSRVMESYIVQADKGGVGATVRVRLVHTEQLDDDPWADYTFIATKVRATAQWAIFELGAPQIWRKRVPSGRVLQDFCRWKYKSTQCGYTGTLATCDKTFADCDTHNNTDRFGGFPAVGRRGVYLRK
jgi:lambda family phage minor tail protein L